jgi:hypothetical protein
LQERLHELIPGGAHTLAKSSDQYPERMAPILVRGAGARIWDVDGRRAPLGQSFVISAAYTDADVAQTAEAARGATVVYTKALESGRPEDLFHGRPVAPAHRRYADPRRLPAASPAGGM